MLRVSARKTGRQADLSAVVDPDLATDSRLDHGLELLRFVDAVVGRNDGS